MYKNKEFDYDLWTTETDGEKKYWVLVRRTNEVVEVNLETMRFLRNQEKGLYRAISSSKDSMLSLDALDENDEKTEEWLVDKHCFEDQICLKMSVASILTEKELSVFIRCFQEDGSLRNYAKKNRLSYSTIKERQDRIKVKLKKFLI